MFIILILWFILGAMIGSFVLVLASRFKEDGFKSSLTGRSQCDSCDHTLNWLDLIPIISFIMLGGKCRYCHKKIAPNHLIAEIGLGLMAVVLAIKFSLFLVVGLNLIIIALLITLALIDYFNQQVLEVILIAALPFIVALAIINHVNYLSVIYGLLVGLGLFFLLFALGRGRWMGFGDVEVASLLGVWLGFPGIVLAIMVAFVSGAIYGVYLLASKKAAMGSRLPFVPFLVFGGVITLLFGRSIISWYLGGL